MFQFGLLRKFWGDAVLNVVFLINKLPSVVLKGKSPFELVYKHYPIFDNIRVFGCLCFAAKLNVSNKFSKRSKKCVLIGYSNDKKKGYKLYSLDNRISFLFQGCEVL